MMATRQSNVVDFIPGEYVLCFEPDSTKARVLYDAKVLEILNTKDGKGKRKIEYMVHFQGWNSSWDRVVHESFIIKNTERNRILRRRLAEIARRVKRNKLRMKRIDNVLKQHFSKQPHFDSDSSSVDSSASLSEKDDDDDDEEDDEDDDDDEEDGPYAACKNGQLKESDSENDLSKLDLELDDFEVQEVDLDLPGNLRRKLEYDCVAINRKSKLIKLPADPNVITILESYAKNFGVNVLCATVEKQKPYPLREQQTEPPEKNINLCKEVMDGLRIFFDFALPNVLLYDAEKQQYNSIASSNKPFIAVKKEPGEQKSEIQTPPASSTRYRNSLSTEPPGKQARLSPRAIKKEVVYSDEEDDGFGPPRRITRKAFAEEVRRNSLKGSDSKTTLDINGAGTSQESRRSRSSKGGSCETKKLGSEGNIVKSRTRSGADQSLIEAAVGKTEKGVLRDRVTPPAPLNLTASAISSSTSNLSTPTSSIDQSIFKHREAAVNDIFMWQMLPISEYQKVPSPPSLVYGAHHLLRLFVRLPEYIEQMPIPRERHKYLLKHLQLFIDYLSNRTEDLFPDEAYEDV